MDIDQPHYSGDNHKNPGYPVHGSMTYGVPPGISTHGQMMDDGSDGIPRTPGPHEYHEKGHPMEWFNSDRFNPYELPKYTGTDFNTFIEKFQRRIKRYEKLTEEDRVGTLFDRLDAKTQLLIRHSPHLNKKADLSALIDSIRLLLHQNPRGNAVIE
ncbi:hypothetical protein HMI55_004686 [Coelomomyces lativittatus]|nr:hypothetical protein HMI55_004686 [Coelomomyces lativittatus]